MSKAPRKTKIVATVGPASSSPEMIARLMNAGVDVFRLNYSHGESAQKLQIIQLIRTISNKVGKQAGILADLQGPKIRTGTMAGDSMLLSKGQNVAITTRNVLGEAGIIPTTYNSLPNDVRSGSRILLDDGLMELKVVAVEGDTVHCHVITGGVLKNNKGINLPGTYVSEPALTAKDLRDLDSALEAGVDFIALSFVRTSEDVELLKRIIYSKGKDTPVVAKIEKPEALRNFKKILGLADSIMVARGDLGVEVQAEKVPFYQKKIIAACNEAGKPVITATQMLDSMVRNPRPTRAETSDVANAIIDGTDAVMLSAETAAGDYPVEAVEIMSRIARDVEHTHTWPIKGDRKTSSPSISRAVAESACQAASSLSAKAIAVFTQTGSTASLISRLRPNIPIRAFTTTREIQSRLSLNWGVIPTGIAVMVELDEAVRTVESSLLASGYHKGDIIVIIMGMPIEARGSTNLMKIHKLGAGRFFEIY